MDKMRYLIAKPGMNTVLVYKKDDKGKFWMEGHIPMRLALEWHKEWVFMSEADQAQAQNDYIERHSKLEFYGGEEL